MEKLLTFLWLLLSPEFRLCRYSLEPMFLRLLRATVKLHAYYFPGRHEVSVSELQWHYELEKKDDFCDIDWTKENIWRSGSS
jgi:hypothetical protein